MPIRYLRNKVNAKSDYFYGQSYKYIDVKDYIKDYNIENEEYCFDSGEKVYILNDFYVSTNKITSYIHDENKNILNQSSPSANHNSLNNAAFRIDIKADKVIELDEAVDFMIFFNENYWHFTFTAMDKLIALEEKDYTGKYILPCKSYIKELVNLTGIAPERFLFPENNEIFKIKRLHIIDCFWGNNKFQNGRQLYKVRKKILSNLNLTDIHNYPKKLYVKRIGTRKIKNENELLNYLEPKGFKVMIPEEYSVAEQIKHFYAADIVLCPHGANSTNALYMRPDTHFIECFSMNCITPYQNHIIKFNNMYYHMLVERRRGEKDINIHSNYNIDLLLLDSVMYNLDKNNCPCK